MRNNVSPLRRDRTTILVPCSTPALASAWADRLRADGHTVQGVRGSGVLVVTDGSMQVAMDVARDAYAGGFAVAEDLSAFIDYEVHTALHAGSRGSRGTVAGWAA